MEIRAAAQRALFSQADRDAIHKALAARPRTQPGEVPYRAGELVFMYRSSPKVKRRGWTGPGVAIAVT
eukprot:8920547-Lingulodinium_polyedra.AAC.1